MKHKSLIVLLYICFFVQSGKNKIYSKQENRGEGVRVMKKKNPEKNKKLPRKC